MVNDPFVDVGDLPSLGPLRYLDVRDQAAFDAGHAPGAVRVPLDEWDAAAKAADTGFTKTAYWDRALSALGVDPTNWPGRREGLGIVARDGVGRIDINKCRLFMLMGEYDYSCTVEMSEATAAKIPGVRFQAMQGIGHFPFAENPKRFAEYVLPILAELEG